MKDIDELLNKLPEAHRPPARVPLDLRDLAYAPICRGMHYGPSGTGCYQLMARRAMYDFLEGNDPDWDEWCVQSSRSRRNLVAIRSKEIVYYRCATCLAHI